MIVGSVLGYSFLLLLFFAFFKVFVTVGGGLDI